MKQALRRIPAESRNLYSPGTEVKVQAQANAGYLFTGFSGTLSGITNPQSLVMAQATAVVANFAAISTDPKDNITFTVLSGAPPPDSQTVSLAAGTNIAPVLTVPVTGGEWLTATLDPEVNPAGLLLSLKNSDVAGLATGIYVTYIVLGTPPGQRVISVTLAVNTAAISGVLDSAGFQAGGLAAEGLFTVFGSNLSTQTQHADVVTPGSLGGTTVTITDSAGVEGKASLLYVAPKRIDLLAPAGLALGAATLTVENGAGGTGSTKLQVAATAPGLFSADQTGQGVAAAVVKWIRPSGEIVTAPAAAWDDSSATWVSTPIDVSTESGQVVLSMYGTGIRGRSSLSGVTAAVGGIPVEVQYAGPQDQYPGRDQVDISLPPSLAGMGDGAIQLTVDGRLANVVSINVR